MKRGELQSPFDDAVVETPSGASSGMAGVTGGFELADGKKETPNSESGLPPRIDVFTIPGGDPGAGGQVDMPPVASPGTIPTGGTGE